MSMTMLMLPMLLLWLWNEMVSVEGQSSWQPLKNQQQNGRYFWETRYPNSIAALPPPRILVSLGVVKDIHTNAKSSLSKGKKSPYGVREVTQWLRALRCSSRGPRFNSQHPHGSSYLPVILVPGNPTPSHVYAGKIPIHIKIKRRNLLMFLVC